MSDSLYGYCSMCGHHTMLEHGKGVCSFCIEHRGWSLQAVLPKVYGAIMNRLAELECELGQCHMRTQSDIDDLEHHIDALERRTHGDGR